MKPRTLIIDDEVDICELLSLTLERMEINCCSVNNLADAKLKLSNQSFDLCLTDVKLPDGDGVEFVRELQSQHGAMPVVVISAHGSIERAIQTLKYGAFDFLTKPVDLSLLRKTIKNALKHTLDKSSTSNELIGNSQPIKNLRKTIDKLAHSQAPIYIGGESGTGKELVARLIHENGPRSDNTFVPVNCGAIPHELIESELFGHMKGSFSGAIANKKGLFQMAEGGTLFLDEIADLPQSIQVKLLRSIQEKSVRAVGATSEVPVNFRLLCATHRPLADMVKQGTFRQDLYYRINVIELLVPPLRERKEDIPLLATHILANIKISDDITINQAALDKLTSYHFPGNVRELQNILERAVILSENNMIDVDDLAFPKIEIAPDDVTQDEDDFDKQQLPLDSYLTHIEKKLIMHTLDKVRWNKTAAAKLLGISFRTLRYRLRKLKLD